MRILSRRGCMKGELDGALLLIRADAGVRMGWGHVMRCLALGQAWQERGGEVGFVMKEPPSVLVTRLKQEGMYVQRLPSHLDENEEIDYLIKFARKQGVSWLVLDGYHFEEMYQKLVHQSGIAVLLLDDNSHLSEYSGDVLLNHNLYADEKLYDGCLATDEMKLLLGSKWVLLRREFWPWRGYDKRIVEVRRILVTLGGSDPDNITYSVLAGLKQLEVEGEPIQVDVIVGGGNPHYQQLLAQVVDKPNWRLLRDVDDMPSLMSQVDLAITAGGGTCWELAFMGVPMLIIILAPNQRQIGNVFMEKGIGRLLGEGTILEPNQVAEQIMTLQADKVLLQEMSVKCQQLITGWGADQVVGELQNRFQWYTRLAIESDKQLLFKWANDSLTRQMSLQSEPIPWETHDKWFNQVLTDDGQMIIIIIRRELGKFIEVGQVRFNRKGVVSIVVAPEWRGQNLGVSILMLGIRHYYRSGGEGMIKAYIKRENKASQKIFERVGFEQAGEEIVTDISCLVYKYREMSDDLY
ncbi:MAG TPA: UDP-2,4-diacetamido-2,4,6-trideoxy-beta-L-altropyranose hydrolase [Anaerolineae bacterium]|nr:UDP-2,4-diacetamido-2,4,6-trideoxy-beta-L-altropyranose hydrolase [Anaerolineae bacterium]